MAGFMSAEASFATLLVAYGSPRSLDEVEPYLLDVRGGRATPPEVVEELRQRYAAIGGCSPLLERTEAQAAALSAVLGAAPVYVGMRHWHPYIADVMGRIRADGHRRVVALALAPHFSRLSIGAYERKIAEARNGAELAMVRQWYDHPGFLDAVAARVGEALARFPAPRRDQVALLFTAHSLPQRILDEGDPYPDQLQASVRGVLDRLGPATTRFAFQSAGRTAEPWLGPTPEEVLAELAGEGVREVLVCPIGFVSDHLEVLYDVDVELQAAARELGLRLERTESQNDHPRFIAALADLVRSAAPLRVRAWAARR
jgi:protoporphyrin/coproporphyrin ferrochelatase